MKKIFLILITSSLLLASCKEETNSGTIYPGIFSFNNQEHNLANSIVEYYGLIDQKHYHKLFFLSDSIQIIPTQNYYNIQGNGYVIETILKTKTQNFNGFYQVSDTSKIELNLYYLGDKKGENPTQTFLTGIIRIQYSEINFSTEIEASTASGKRLLLQYNKKPYFFNLQRSVQ
ncbi:MAG TPA: hypothetical protein PK990_05565 [Salinivirgaceae bacterium]|nr:hypothetical protein [Salinivirgaceae bacterium]